MNHVQAQKLISLCGRKPLILPYIVGCKGRQNQSIKDANFATFSNGQDQRLVFIPPCVLMVNEDISPVGKNIDNGTSKTDSIIHRKLINSTQTVADENLLENETVRELLK